MIQELFFEQTWIIISNKKKFPEDDKTFVCFGTLNMVYDLNFNSARKLLFSFTINQAGKVKFYIYILER